MKAVSLWRNPDFLKLWAGQTVSELGSRITRDGLPLLAVMLLDASPMQMGFLSAANSLPVLIFGLVAGVWVDRLRHRPILIAADLGRALLLVSIPLAAVLGRLSLGQIYIVTALAGLLTIFFDLAYRAYLPALVEREHILEGNARLSLSDSIAELIGPGLAGVLVQVLTAPIAMLFDALSYLVSVVSVALIRKPEPPAPPPEQRESLLAELKEGLLAVIHSPVLRPLAAALGTLSFFGNFIGVLYALYAYRDLHLTAAMLGLTIAGGGAGSLLGSLLAERIAGRFRLGYTLITALVLISVFSLTIPLAAGTPLTVMFIWIVGQVLGDCARTVYFVNEISLRQRITPDHLLGRTGASMEVLASGLAPLGALVGGLLGETIGAQQTLLIAAAGGLLAAGWLFFSQVRRL